MGASPEHCGSTTDYVSADMMKPRAPALDADPASRHAQGSAPAAAQMVGAAGLPRVRATTASQIESEID